MSELLLERREESRVMRCAVEVCSDAIMITRADPRDLPGPIVYVNPAFEALTGYSAAQALGQGPHLLEGDRTDPRECRRIREALRKSEKISARLVHYHRDGRPLRVELHISPVGEDDGNATHFVAILREIGREVQQAELEEKTELFEAVMETTMDGLGVLESIRDEEGAIRDFSIRLMNRRLAEIAQSCVDETVGHRLLEKYPGVKEEGLFDAYCQVADTGQPFHTDIKYRHEGLNVSLRITAVRMGDGVLITMTDITDLKRRERNLQLERRAAQRAAMHDSLTQLPNRAYLLQHLQNLQAAAKEGWYALVVIDLDRFKMLNDTYGHRAGDSVLGAVAGALVGTIRHDDFAARVGGDEFVAVLHLGARDFKLAERLTQRLLDKVRMVLPEPADASAGFGIWRTTGQRAEDVLAEADRVMYENKRTRR